MENKKYQKNGIESLRLGLGSGDLLYTFLKEKLVDELILTIAPTIIGKGIPLFKVGDYQLDLYLKGTRTYNQFVELHYIVKK